MHTTCHPVWSLSGKRIEQRTTAQSWISMHEARDGGRLEADLRLRAGQKGWKKVHYWLLFAVSRHIGWMPSTTTTMWLHFYCIEDGAWIADRFLVVLPPRWRVVWTFLRPIGAKSVLKSHYNFCAQGDSITGQWTRVHYAWIFSTLKHGRKQAWIFLVLSTWFWSTPNPPFTISQVIGRFSKILYAA